MRSCLLPIRLLALGSVLAATLVFLLSAPSSAQAAGCPGAGAHPGDASIAKVRRATRCLLNARRAARGKPSLRGNAKLTRASTRHSRAMARGDFFSHDSLNGDSVVDRIRRTGYLRGSRSWAVGENIGWGSGYRATPRAMVRAWMRSPGHRANILNRRFRHVGVGAVRGAPEKGYAGAATYTTDFGRR